MDTDTLDRDIIDVTIPTAEDHLAWVRDLIAHRAPEFGPADIAEAYSIPTEFEPDPHAAIWIALAEQVVDALAEVEQRLSRIEADLRQR